MMPSRLWLRASCLGLLLFVFDLAGCESGGEPDAGSYDTDASDSGDGDAADGDPSEGDGDSSDYPPARPAVIPLDGQMLFPVLLDDRPETYHMVVDTGAFVTAVEETLVRDVENGVGVVTIDFGEGIVLVDQRVFTADLSAAEEHIGVPIHGLIGQDIFQETFFGLDYRRSEVTMASEIPESPPPGFASGDAVEVAYALEQLMPVVEVDVGGRTARLIADTGSGVTLLTESFVAPELLASGLSGYIWYTSYGSDPGTIVRLPAITVGGRPVPDTWAVIVPDEYHLKPVFDAIGLQVDGFLGYPVYRRFYVAVHGTESRYLFYPYPDLAHVNGAEWDRVGLEIMRSEGQVLIDMIFEPSDASAKGVLSGDVLLEIDGAPVADLPLDDIRLLLRGQPGTTKILRLLCDQDELTFDVAVDRLLDPL